MSNRVFSDEELRELGTRTLDLLTEAIEAGDKERARQLAERMYNECLSAHDTYVDWVTSLLSHTYRKVGADGLTEALRAAHPAPGEDAPDPWTNDFKARVRSMAAGLRMHQMPIRIEEDDEKVTLKMEPCGSGQRQVARGRYKRAFCMIQEALPITWGKTDFPIYCTHAPMLETRAIERFGHPNYVVCPPEKVAREESCSYSIYKRLEDVPEEVWTRVGKQKPK